MLKTLDTLRLHNSFINKILLIKTLSFPVSGDNSISKYLPAKQTISHPLRNTLNHKP